jgi:hypothetical protein
MKNTLLSISFSFNDRWKLNTKRVFDDYKRLKKNIWKNQGKSNAYTWYFITDRMWREVSSLEFINSSGGVAPQMNFFIFSFVIEEEEEFFFFSDILKSVQLGHSIKDIVDKYPRRVCDDDFWNIKSMNKHEKPSLQGSSRVESADIHRIAGVTGEEKESDVLYDMLLDDFEEDDDGDESR